MNAELVSGGERRILIPTVYRDDYVTGLRVHTRQGHPDPLIKTMDLGARAGRPAAVAVGGVDPRPALPLLASLDPVRSSATCR